MTSISKLTYANADSLYNFTYWTAAVLGVLAANKLMKPDIEFENFKAMKIIDQIKYFLFKPTLVGWIFISMIFFSFRLSSVKENKQALEKQHQKEADTATAGQNKRELIHIEDKNALEIAHAVGIAKDETNAQAQKNAETMSDIFTGKTREILSDASATKSYLKHTIDSLQRKLDSLKGEPDIIHAAESIIIQQSRDTCYIRPAFRNNGKEKAKNFHIYAYYIYSQDGSNFEFHSPITFLDGGDVGGDQTYIAQNVANIPDFHFDSSKNYQYILMLGSYGNEIPIELCYSWDIEVRKWTISGLLDKVKKAHYDVQHLKYF